MLNRSDAGDLFAGKARAAKRCDHRKAVRKTASGQRTKFGRLPFFAFFQHITSKGLDVFSALALRASPKNQTSPSKSSRDG